MEKNFTANGNGTAFVHELDRRARLSPPWAYGIEQVWDGASDYKPLRRALFRALLTGSTQFFTDVAVGSHPFVEIIFNRLFAFAPIWDAGWWRIGYLGTHAELGFAPLFPIDAAITAEITAARHGADRNLMARIESVCWNEQTEESLQDVEQLQTERFLIHRCAPGQVFRQRVDDFIDGIYESNREEGNNE